MLTTGYSLLDGCLAPTAASHSWDTNFVSEFSLGPEATDLLANFGLFYATLRWQAPHTVVRLTASQNIEVLCITASDAATSLGMHLSVAAAIGGPVANVAPSIELAGFESCGQGVSCLQ